VSTNTPLILSLPPGTALTTLLGLPLVSDIVSGMGSDQGASILTILENGLVINFLILCVSSLAGSFVAVQFVARANARGALNLYLDNDAFDFSYVP